MPVEDKEKTEVDRKHSEKSQSKLKQQFTKLEVRSVIETTYSNFFILFMNILRMKEVKSCE